jgi:hypothetical protein
MKYQRRGADLVRVSMLFPRSLWKRLRVKAVNEDTTATKLIVNLVEEYIKKGIDKNGMR